ncbi:hypothetical protein [Anatilimnocola aggregata]|nr:hypothetical protein [Anatilimnocola aggregata]
MFGLGPNYLEVFAPLAAIYVWQRLFVSNGRCSLLSLLILLTGIALWLTLFRPWDRGATF